MQIVFTLVIPYLLNQWLDYVCLERKHPKETPLFLLLYIFWISRNILHDIFQLFKLHSGMLWCGKLQALKFYTLICQLLIFATWR